MGLDSKDKLDGLQSHIDSRFDRLEIKIDDHLQRLTAAEVTLEFVKGHLKISTAIGLSIAGTLLGWWFTRVSG